MDRRLARHKIYTYKEMDRLLRNNGFVLVRTKGDHFIYKKEGLSDNVVITAGQNNKMVCKRLIKMYSLYE